jgi:hypothetical protein
MVLRPYQKIYTSREQNEIVDAEVGNGVEAEVRELKETWDKVGEYIT